jgi:hypothetical protein
MSEQAIYLYCLVHAAKKPSWAKGPAGLPGGAKPHAVEAQDGWWLVVSAVPSALYDERTIEAGLKDLDWVSARALAHEQVVERATRLGPVVPMKLFTLFHDEARAVAHVKKQRRVLARLRERLSGCAEWGVRVRFEPKAVALTPVARPATGADFLKRKQALHGNQRDRAKAGLARAQDLLRALEDSAREARIRPQEQAAGATLLAEGAFLVPTRGAASFRAAVKRAAQAFAPEGLEIDLTGPWPAYHFVAEAP